MISFKSVTDIEFSYYGTDYLDISRNVGDYDLDFQICLPITEIENLIETLQEISKEHKQVKANFIKRKINELHTLGITND